MNIGEAITDPRITEDCPFCGYKANEIQLIMEGFNQYSIVCPNCKASFALISTKELIIRRWNNRNKSDDNT